MKKVKFNAFSGLALKAENFSKKTREGHVFIEESFDTVFNMGYIKLTIIRKIHKLSSTGCGRDGRNETLVSTMLRNYRSHWIILVIRDY